MLRNRDDPVKSGGRDRRVKIVYLVCGDRRSPEQCQSYVSEGALLCCSGGPVFPLHHAVVSRGTAKRYSISLIVGTHASKGAAPGDTPFEMVDVRRFEVRACRLIVAAILIQRWNWVRIGAPVRGHRLLFIQRIIRGWNCQRQQGQCPRIQAVSATVVWAGFAKGIHWSTSVNVITSKHNNPRGLHELLASLSG